MNKEVRDTENVYLATVMISSAFVVYMTVEVEKLCISSTLKASVILNDATFIKTVNCCSHY